MIYNVLEECSFFYRLLNADFVKSHNFKMHLFGIFYKGGTLWLIKVEGKKNDHK